MKKICIFLLVILVVVLLLQGCTETKLDYGSRIIPPNNKIIPINGTWMINKFENSGEKVRIYKDDTQWIGKMVVFNEKSVVVGEEICEEAHYKVKSVKAKDYFLFRHRIRVEELKIQDQMIDVISVSSDDKPFYDFIKFDNTHAMIYLEDGLFSMEKVSDDSNKNILVHNEAESAQTEEPLPPDPELLRSGILLGLRAKPFSGNGRTVYRTLWIASHNRTLHPVLETPNLFIPRKDGFWRMEVKKKKVNDFIQDALVAYPMDQDFRQNSGLENQQIEEGHVQNTILFVGDDYVAIESTNSFHDNTQFISRYKMLPIDNAQSNMGVKLSEIEGEKAKEIFDKSAEAFLLSQTKEIENIETVIDESNFTMARRNGHWILRGRLNYDDATGRNNYVDFNIGMVPSQKLVNYDEMCISWNVIKARVPQALDAYTSPNGDMLIIITKNLISIYTLREHKISDKPIKNISIQEGESVVMAEWATGEYMERWEKGFNQLNPYILGD